jgi:hypothetical protein
MGWGWKEVGEGRGKCDGMKKKEKQNTKGKFFFFL